MFVAERRLACWRNRPTDGRTLGITTAAGPSPDALSSRMMHNTLVQSDPVCVLINLLRVSDAMFCNRSHVTFMNT